MYGHEDEVNNLKKEETTMRRRMRRKEGRKEGRKKERKEGRKEGRRGDLLRLFPPCVAVCRLAGSILTLRGEQQEVKG